MAKKRGISISLAAKCQLLFGLAVLVIIAGALAVPWQRMEQLAGQPNVKAAHFAADLLFRQIHAHAPEGAVATRPTEILDVPAAGAAGAVGGMTTGTMPATAPAGARPTTLAAGTAAGSSTAPATTTAATTSPAAATMPANWNRITLSNTEYPPPRLYPTMGPTRGFPRDNGAEDALAIKALAFFRAHGAETETGSVTSTPDRNGEKTLMYRYFAAVRLERSCLQCHAEYSSWVTGPLAAMRGGGNGENVSVRLSPTTMAALQTTLPSATEPAAPLAGSGRGETAAWPVVGVIRVDVPYQTDENQLLLNRIVIVVAGMVGGTLAIVVFYLITSRLILQPVRVLKNTAEKVAAGDLKIRSAISTGDEFQHLSETFNTMLATLQASQNQLEATNRSLDTRVGELAQSNVDLFEANRLKSEFLTNVTHELRTPLNAIIGFADLMAETARSKEDAKLQRYSENIRTSAKQLLDLINDLLDLAKIEAGKLVLREEKVNVADVCEAMANFMRPLAQKKEIELVLSVAPDMPLITTDPGRFQQILYNFLSNAIKFTPPEGQVSITARNEPMAADAGVEGATVGSPLVRIDVTDTGPGISAEDQKVIFEKFRQIDGSVTRQHSGTGLGLTISRELANMLGGRIELTSTFGKGATFSLVIPAVNPHRTIEMHSTLENA